MSDVKNARYRQMRNVNDPRTRHISDEGFMKVFDWLGENRRHFQSAVEPACFSVNVTDPEIAYAIEAVIPVAAGKVIV